MSACLTAVPVILFTFQIECLVCKRQMKLLSANTHRTELRCPLVLEKVMYMYFNLGTMSHKKHEIFAE